VLGELDARRQTRCRERLEVRADERGEIAPAHRLRTDHVLDAEAERVEQEPARGDTVVAGGSRDEHERDSRRSLGAEIDVVPARARDDEQFTAPAWPHPTASQLARAARRWGPLGGNTSNKRRDHGGTHPKDPGDLMRRRGAGAQPPNLLEQLAIVHRCR